MQEVVTKVEKQELEITYIKRTLDELVEQNKKQSEQLSKISDSIAKQEIILERISSLEEKYQDGLRRCHDRIDSELDRCKEDRSRVKEELNSLKVELNSKPCNNYRILEEKLASMHKKIETHGKIFWWIGTLILGAVILAMVKAHLKM